MRDDGRSAIPDSIDDLDRRRVHDKLGDEHNQHQTAQHGEGKPEFFSKYDKQQGREIDDQRLRYVAEIAGVQCTFVVCLFHVKTPYMLVVARRDPLPKGRGAIVNTVPRFYPYVRTFLSGDRLAYT